MNRIKQWMKKLAEDHPELLILMNFLLLKD
jgi:hypothetical protein